MRTVEPGFDVVAARDTSDLTTRVEDGTDRTVEAGDDHAGPTVIALRADGTKSEVHTNGH